MVVYMMVWTFFRHITTSVKTSTNTKYTHTHTQNDRDTRQSTIKSN